MPRPLYALVDRRLPVVASIKRVLTRWNEEVVLEELPGPVRS